MVINAYLFLADGALDLLASTVIRYDTQRGRLGNQMPAGEQHDAFLARADLLAYRAEEQGVVVALFLQFYREGQQRFAALLLL